MKSSVGYARYDDEGLIDLIAQSHEEALVELYERYGHSVFSLALVIVEDEASAEEVTLHTFMYVWEKAASYRGEQTKVATWLMYIARHRAISILHDQGPRENHFASCWIEITSHGILPEDPQEFADISFRRNRILTALNDLSADQKRVIALACFGGYTQRQIAEILKQPLGTVKTCTRLGMQKLRDFLSSGLE